MIEITMKRKIKIKQNRPAYSVLLWTLVLGAMVTTVAIAGNSLRGVLSRRVKQTSSFVLWDRWPDGSDRQQYVDRHQDGRRTTKVDGDGSVERRQAEVHKKGGLVERRVWNPSGGPTNRSSTTVHSVGRGSESLLGN